MGSSPIFGISASSSIHDPTPDAYYDVPMKVSVIIPAAGRSSRFGDKDKLAEDLGGRPLLMRTVEFFTKREEVTQIIVAAPPDSYEDFKDRFGPPLSFHGVVIVKGGKARWESVQNTLPTINTEIDRVVIHDAARPAISNELFNSLMLAARELEAVAAALPISGTVKRTKQAKKTIGDDDDIADSVFGEAGRATVDAFPVEQTIDRTRLWELQTPQIFSLELLLRAYVDAKQVQPTDDAQLVEALGEVVYLVRGDSRNIKVTTKSDLALVKAVLGVKDAAQRPAHKRF